MLCFAFAVTECSLLTLTLASQFPLDICVGTHGHGYFCSFFLSFFGRVCQCNILFCYIAMALASFKIRAKAIAINKNLLVIVVRKEGKKIIFDFHHSMLVFITCALFPDPSSALDWASCGCCFCHCRHRHCIASLCGAVKQFNYFLCLDLSASFGTFLSSVHLAIVCALFSWRCFSECSLLLLFWFLTYCLFPWLCFMLVL